MNDLDEAILFLYSTLFRDSAKFTTGVVTDELTAQEQEHYAKSFAMLADSIRERAEQTKRRVAKGKVSDISSARGDVDTKAG